jgi:hypothetical protein
MFKVEVRIGTVSQNHVCCKRYLHSLIKMVIRYFWLPVSQRQQKSRIFMGVARDPILLPLAGCSRPESLKCAGLESATVTPLYFFLPHPHFYEEDKEVDSEVTIDNE